MWLYFTYSFPPVSVVRSLTPEAIPADATLFMSGLPALQPMSEEDVTMAVEAEEEAEAQVEETSPEEAQGEEAPAQEEAEAEAAPFQDDEEEEEAPTEDDAAEAEAEAEASPEEAEGVAAEDVPLEESPQVNAYYQDEEEEEEPAGAAAEEESAAVEEAQAEAEAEASPEDAEVVTDDVPLGAFPEPYAAEGAEQLIGGERAEPEATADQVRGGPE
jgi:hypothetical protein